MKKLIILGLISFSNLSLAVTEKKAPEADYTFTNEMTYKISLAIDDSEYFDLKPDQTLPINYKKDIGVIHLYLRILHRKGLFSDVYIDEIFVKEPSKDITLGKKDQSDKDHKYIEFTYKQPDLKR